MKRIVSFLLIMVLIISLSSMAFAVKSPGVEALLLPPITNAYFKICNADGQLVRYLSVDDIKCAPIEDVENYIKIPNLLYAFNFSSVYELKDGEYIEFPIYFNNLIDLELDAMVLETEHQLTINKIIDHYWMLNITEYGNIIITIIPEE